MPFNVSLIWSQLSRLEDISKKLEAKIGVSGLISSLDTNTTSLVKRADQFIAKAKEHKDKLTATTQDLIENTKQKLQSVKQDIVTVVDAAKIVHTVHDNFKDELLDMVGELQDIIHHISNLPLGDTKISAVMHLLQDQKFSNTITNLANNMMQIISSQPHELFDESLKKLEKTINLFERVITTTAAAKLMLPNIAQVTNMGIPGFNNPQLTNFKEFVNIHQETITRYLQTTGHTLRLIDKIDTTSNPELKTYMDEMYNNNIIDLSQHQCNRKHRLYYQHPNNWQHVLNILSQNNNISYPAMESLHHAHEQKNLDFERLKLQIAQMQRLIDQRHKLDKEIKQHILVLAQQENNYTKEITTLKYRKIAEKNKILRGFNLCFDHRNQSLKGLLKKTKNILAISQRVYSTVKQHISLKSSAKYCVNLVFRLVSNFTILGIKTFLYIATKAIFLFIVVAMCTIKFISCAFKTWTIIMAAMIKITLANFTGLCNSFLIIWILRPYSILLNPLKIYSIYKRIHNLMYQNYLMPKPRTINTQF